MCQFCPFTKLKSNEKDLLDTQLGFARQTSNDSLVKKLEKVCQAHTNKKKNSQAQTVVNIMCDKDDHTVFQSEQPSMASVGKSTTTTSAGTFDPSDGASMFMPFYGDDNDDRAFSSSPPYALSLKPFLRPFPADDDTLLSKERHHQPPYISEQRYSGSPPGIFKSLESVDTFSVGSSVGSEMAIGGDHDWMDMSEDGIGNEGSVRRLGITAFDGMGGQSSTPKGLGRPSRQSTIATAASFAVDDDEQAFADQLLDDAMDGLLDIGRESIESGILPHHRFGRHNVDDGAVPAQMIATSTPFLSNKSSKTIASDCNNKSVNKKPEAKSNVARASTTPPSSPGISGRLGRCRKKLTNNTVVTPDETPLAVATIKVPPLEAFNSKDSKFLSMKRKVNSNVNFGPVSELSSSSPVSDQDDLTLPEVGPFPPAMKPILRILLLLDETCRDDSKVRRAFEIVQICCRKYQQNTIHAKKKDMTTKFHELTGEIFEELINEVGERLLGQLLLSSQSYENPRLNDLLKGGVCMLDYDSVHAAAAAAGTPRSIELAVAYGAHYRQLHPSAALNLSLPDIVRVGSLAVESMTETERKELWTKLVGMPLP